MRKLAVGDAVVEIAEAGAGGKPLIFVHGFTGAKEDIGDHLEDLAAIGYHAVAPDLLGHGGSDQPAEREAYSLGRYAQDVVALADALGFERFTLMGHSMGGMIAQQVALAAPDRVERLVLLSTAPGAPDFSAPIRAAARVGGELVTRFGLQPINWVNRNLERFAAPPSVRAVLAARPELVDYNQEKTMRSSPTMWSAMSREILGLKEWTRLLGSVRVPTLIMVGAEDSPFLGPSMRMAAALPNAVLTVIPRAAHSPQFEAPAAFWEALSRFLRPAGG